MRRHNSCWLTVEHSQASISAMNERLRRCGASLARLWNDLQIELNGAYSVERLQQLRDYSEGVSTIHCILVLITTTLPCLLVTIVIESIPLRPPSDGIEHSFLLWVRTFALTTIVVLGFMWPCRVVVPGLPSAITPVVVRLRSWEPPGPSESHTLSASPPVHARVRVWYRHAHHGLGHDGRLGPLSS